MWLPSWPFFSDMIFSLRLLLEKSIERHVKGVFVLIGLKKAYDSVPPDCLRWVYQRNLFSPLVLSILACRI